MTDHTRFEMLVALAVSEDLTTAQRAELNAHLDGCDRCRQLAASLRDDQRRLASVRALAVSTEVRHAVLAAARAPQRGQTWLLLAAALLVLVAMVGLLVAGALLTRAPVELTTAWQEIPAIQLSAGTSTSRVRAITATASAFFAVGSAGGDAAVWASTDGVAWRLVPPLPERQGAELVAVHVGLLGLFAVGRSGSGTSVWTSPDGYSWQPAQPAGELRGLALSAVCRGSDGWLAVGARTGLDGVAGVVLSSADGATWVRVDPPVADGWIPPLTAVANLPDGRWVVVGGVDTRSEGPYVSADGASWSTARELSAVQDMGGLVSFGSTMLGFGRRDVQLSWSLDGRTWTSAAIPLDVSGQISAIEVIGDQAVALGTAGSGPLILRSADGRAWVADDVHANSRTTTAYDIAALGEVEAVVGIKDGLGVIWVRRR